MDYQAILNEIRKETAPLIGKGRAADYIPELSKIDSDQYGMHLSTLQGGEYSFGNNLDKFSIQSISKVFSLSMAMSLMGKSIWERVGVEPSGNAFNSIVQLEYEQGLPRNPFINAGALVIADILLSCYDEPLDELLGFVRELAGTSNIEFNETLAKSEKHSGYLNAALANMLKSQGRINNNVETLLEFYTFQCSIEMSCKELSMAFLNYADHTKDFCFQEVCLSKSQVKRINALMLTCGFYDESGEFSFRVGLPGKSGVGGGIVALQPELFSTAVWSPRLNDKGNSVLGMKSLELLTTKTGISIF